MIQMKRKLVYFNQIVLGNSRRRKILFYFGVGLVLFCLLMVSKVYEIRYTENVPEEDPGVVWDFLSDFTNMKKLNPTIIDFTITSDHGSFEHWEYGVRYSEYLSNIPFIYNFADANIKVYKKLHEYIVESNHTTCFFGNLFCLNSWSKFICTRASSINRNKYTIVTEEIAYECPRLASIFCRSEVKYQREQIFQNLIRHFENKKTNNL